MEYFRLCALVDLFNYNNQRAYYPDMVRLFYANIEGNEVMAMTTVKGVDISLSSGDIGRTFNLRDQGLTLKDIDLNNDGILNLIFTDGEVPKGQIFQNSLTSEAKVIFKIIIQDILPKINSRHYLSIDHVKLLYVIFGGLNFNWAKFFFEQMIKDHTSCIPYGALITRIFEEKKIVLKTELDKTFCKEYIDKATLKRMKLIDSDIGTPYASSSKQPQTSPTKSSALENEILDKVRMIGAMVKDLTKRVEAVENKVEDIHAKTCEKVGSNKTPKKNEEQEGVSKRRRKICVSKRGSGPSATPTPTTLTEEPFEIDE